MGCCENKHIIQASEEYIRENLFKMKLKSFTYEEMYKLVDSFVITGKIPKKIIQKSILNKDNVSFSDISLLEENFHEFIINHYPNTMSIHECLFYLYIFLNHSNDLIKCNKNLFDVFYGFSKGKLTLSTLEKLLYDYLFFSTFKVNFFFESNLKGADKDFQEELQILNKNLFNNNNIKVIVKTLLSKFYEKNGNMSENTIIEQNFFSNCLQEINLSSVIEVRDMFYATFIF